MSIDLRSPDALTPAWWLRRLMQRLYERQDRLQRWDDYYSGQQPLAFASDKFREAFGGRFRAFSSNFCALVVDGTRERLEVQGFRFGDANGDKDLWRIWQENDLDGGSQIAHTEALIKGVAYTIVEPTADGLAPVITVEDPLDCIVELAPKDRRHRLAGLKRWLADDGYLMAYLYLPDAIYKYRSTKPWIDPLGGLGALSSLGQEWLATARFDEFRTDDEEWPLPNALRTVPIVPLFNRPRLRGEGQSEIAPVISNQDAINKYRADALVAAEFAAFRQRWLMGVDIPVDPDTNQPVQTFKAAVDHLWMIPGRDPDDPGASEPKVGEFEATDLAPYQRMIETEVGHMSSIARMPYHYLLGQPTSVPPSGESIKASEAGLVKKVMTAQIHLGDGWEETMRLALRAMRDERADLRTAETIWADPETRNEGVRTDSIIKQFQAGIIDRRVALEALGYSPEQIDRMTGVETTEPVADDGPDVADKVSAAGTLIRSGFDPQDALRAVGLDPIEHLGLLPVALVAQIPSSSI